MMRTFTFFLIGMLLLLLLSPKTAFAGTGQIFSPAGLPQSSTQTYTPPTAGNTPTVTFPTPPLPLGEGLLQGFSGTSLPLSNTNTQGPAGSTGGATGTQQPAPNPTETNSVESFFQCNPPTSVPNAAPQTKKQPSVLKTSRKIIWHTLDNLGVPMFIGKDADLDPSLSQAYVMPPLPSPTQNVTPVTPQRIPESELEGIDVSPKDEQPLPLH